MGQPQLTRFRQVRVTTPVAAPTDVTTAPHITLSPTAPSAQPTTGFLFMLKAPTAGPATGPFTVTPWVRDPTTGFWGSGLANTGVSYGDLFSCFDVDAADLYWQVTASADGAILLNVAEQ